MYRKGGENRIINGAKQGISESILNALRWEKLINHEQNIGVLNYE